MREYCCETMQRQVEYKCDMHDDPFDCPDILIYYSERFDEYGLIIHDGGTAFISIEFCPWCGKKLPESKRDLWFGTLEEMGYDNPADQDIPEEYNSAEWYKRRFD